LAGGTPDGPLDSDRYGAGVTTTTQALIFDFDGTMVDSDDALIQPFLALGVPLEEISFGHAIAEECDRLGISLDAYADLYDEVVVQPFPDMSDVVQRLGRWALCSNKHPRSGASELARLGWTPEIALFSDHFDWAHKSLGPVLEALGLSAAEVVMVGDSGGDVRVALEVGCDFVWAGWNPRVAAARPDGSVLDRPDQLLDLYG
jgi:HAD superfamily hydrolase (TIGR01549 family)